ncbi:MAG: CapA family protein [Chloroflexota bacterium]
MTETVTLFLCGDVMTARGIDQALPYPGDPELHEHYVKDARHYRTMIESASGPVLTPLDYRALWGAALDELARVQPAARIINLETSITRSDAHWRGKAVHYRMNPANIGCLDAAAIDCCALANNHVLDWGYPGLDDTLTTLGEAGMSHCGAGADLRAARSPAVLPRDGYRIIVVAAASTSSGVPKQWAAGPQSPGVHLLSDQPEVDAARIAEDVQAVRQPGDVVVASLHWGPNWSYDIPPQHIDLAHHLIDRAGVDVVHGHSSHHVKAFEVYHGKLVLYGCGDFINDYEGISGHEAFRGDLSLMYFPTLARGTGHLIRLEMVPTTMHRAQVRRASDADAGWLAARLNREGQRFGMSVSRQPDGRLLLDCDSQ